MKIMALLLPLLLLVAAPCHAKRPKGVGVIGKNWRFILNPKICAGVTEIDSSSNTVSMTLNSGVSIVSGLLGRGCAFNFDGSNDNITVDVARENLYDYQVTSAFAVIVFFNMPNADGSSRVFVSKVPWPNTGWAFHTGSTNDRLGMYFRGSAIDYHYFNAVGITDAKFKNNKVLIHGAGFRYSGVNTTAGIDFFLDGVKYASREDAALGTVTDIQNAVALRIGLDETPVLPALIDTVYGVLMSAEGYFPSDRAMKDIYNFVAGRIASAMIIQ